MILLYKLPVFFFIRDCIKEQKAHESVPGAYNELEKQKQKNRRENKNSSHPQEGPDQFTQSTKDKPFPWRYTQIHKAILQRKELLRLWSDISASSNTLWFLSFQIVQNIHKGVALRAFLHLLPTGKLSHPRRVSWTEPEIIHWILNKENISCHKTLALTQWRRKRSMVSDSSLQSARLLTSDQPLLWSWSKVNTFPQQASQAKNLTLEGTQGFQMISTGKCLHFVLLGMKNTLPLALAPYNIFCSIPLYSARNCLIKG